MIQKGIFAELAADTGIASIAGDRFFEVASPPDLTQFPCLVLTLVGGAVEQTLSTSGVVRQRVEISAFAIDYATAATLREAVKSVLDGWSQKLDDGLDVITTLLLNPGTDMVSEERIFRCMVEFYILYTLPA